MPHESGEGRRFMVSEEGTENVSVMGENMEGQPDDS